MTTFYARTKRDRDKLVGQFVAYVSEWQPVVGLSEWSVFVHGCEEAGTKEGSHGFGSGSGAVTFDDLRYLEATILLRSGHETEWEEKELEETAVHELLHVVLTPVMSFLEHDDDAGSQLCKQIHIAEEGVCTRLARALMAAKYQVRSQLAGRASGTKGRAERQPSQVA